jgi:hypothetical protein
MCYRGDPHNVSGRPSCSILEGKGESALQSRERLFYFLVQRMEKARLSKSHGATLRSGTRRSIGPPDCVTPPQPGWLFQDMSARILLYRLLWMGSKNVPEKVALENAIGCDGGKSQPVLLG